MKNERITGTSGTVYELRGLKVWMVSPIGDLYLSSVSHPDDFGSAVEVEDEELRCLLAAAREEFAARN